MLAVYQFLSCCNLPSLIIIDRSMKVATYYILYTISKHYVESHSQCLLTIIYISSCPVIIRLEKGIFQWVYFNPCHDRDMWIWLLCVPFRAYVCVKLVHKMPNQKTFEFMGTFLSRSI